ncbi:MAG: hypothetical protein OEL87_00625 [Nanoarchaeota archaeon]|nr:hypothetical protein [Nanoarchaeota archaeon]
MNKKAQQEMVGFVLIVVLVMVGMMVFLVISLRDAPEERGSLQVGYVLDAIMKHTTECAVIYEPDYDNFEDLFKSCYKNDKCSNLGVSACDYLNKTLREVVGDMMDTEATVSSYQVNFFSKDDTGQQGILTFYEGNCTGVMSAAQRSIISGSESLIIQMKICGLTN